MTQASSIIRVAVMPLRSKAKHYVIGSPSVLPVNQLPTNRDVVNYVRLLAGGTKSEGRVTACIREAAEAVIAMWSAEGIPTIQTHNVVRKMKQVYERFRRSNKVPKRMRERQAKQSLSEVSQFRKLFDIARCRCKDLRRCTCPLSNRIPPAEIAFLRDQRGVRKMKLGGVDYEETRKRRKTASLRMRRRTNEGQGDVDQAGSSFIDTDSSGLKIDETCQTDSPGTTDTNDSNKDVTSESETKEYVQEANDDDLTNTALAADRYGLSNRAVAAIINGFQIDIGRVASGKTKLLVDPKKVWRERCRMRQSAVATRDQQHRDVGLKALYFDGRHDQTSTGRGGDTTAEEHVAVVAEPGNEYLTHFTPISGKAIDQTNELINVTAGYGDSVRVLGCDGAAVNTGRSGGICRLFELIQEKTVHWFVCQLHSNELVLREVFQKLDGKTSGPGSFTGPLGKAAGGSVHRLSPVKFRPVNGPELNLPDNIVVDLSSDQLLLYHLTRAVQTGKISPKEACKKIGPLNHAR